MRGFVELVCFAKVWKSPKSLDTVFANESIGKHLVKNSNRQRRWKRWEFATARERSAVKRAGRNYFLRFVL